MIALSRPLEVSRSGRDEVDEWELILWIGDPFDFTIPFRSALREIQATLSRSAACVLNIPPHNDGEDFVEGQLTWGTDLFKIYFEHSLAYLSLRSSSAAAGDRLSGALSPIMVATTT